MNDPFAPPPHHADRQADLVRVAARHEGGAVELSIGTPCDPPPALVAEALARAETARGYPPSIGTLAFREAAAGWMERRTGVQVSPDAVAACVGTKELVASLPHLLRLRRPDRDTVLYPAIAYPTYAMGAAFAGCRAVGVPADDRWELDLDAIDPGDAERALCLWVNAPGNPAGGLDDLVAAAEWGRRHGIPVVSDECYVEFTWDGPRRTILEAGDEGVLALHSLSKRSNLAGARAGCYAGDPTLVSFLSEVRKHLGLMVPGPVQAAAAAAWDDDEHVEVQADRYRRRLERLVAILARLGVAAELPRGAFYLWVPAPDGDAWGLAHRLAHEAGIVVRPGEYYGAAGAGHIRVAAVCTDDRLDLVDERLGRR